MRRCRYRAAQRAAPHLSSHSRQSAAAKASTAVHAEKYTTAAVPARENTKHGNASSAVTPMPPRMEIIEAALCFTA